jgi:hypothetical protein
MPLGIQCPSGRPEQGTYSGYEPAALLINGQLLIDSLCVPLMIPFYLFFPRFSRKKSCENALFEEKTVFFSIFL